MGFHETFWVISGTAAPIIALAAVVSYGDLREQENDVSQAWDSWLSRSREVQEAANQTIDRLAGIQEELNQLKAQLKARIAGTEVGSGESSSAVVDILRKLLKSPSPKQQKEADDDLLSRLDDLLDQFDGFEKEIEKNSELLAGTDKQVEPIIARFRKHARQVRDVQLTNLIVQATLLCVSLVSVAYQFNAVPPIVAIVAAAGGILCLTFVAYWLSSVRTGIKKIQEIIQGSSPAYDAALAKLSEVQRILSEVNI